MGHKRLKVIGISILTGKHVPANEVPILLMRSKDEEGGEKMEEKVLNANEQIVQEEVIEAPQVENNEVQPVESQKDNIVQPEPKEEQPVEVQKEEDKPENSPEAEVKETPQDEKIEVKEESQPVEEVPSATQEVVETKESEEELQLDIVEKKLPKSILDVIDQLKDHVDASGKKLLQLLLNLIAQYQFPYGYPYPCPGYGYPKPAEKDQQNDEMKKTIEKFGRKLEEIEKVLQSLNERFVTKEDLKKSIDEVLRIIPIRKGVDKGVLEDKNLTPIEKLRKILSNC